MINQAGRVLDNAARKQNGITPLPYSQVSANGRDGTVPLQTPYKQPAPKTATAQAGATSTPWTPYSAPGYGENYWNQTGSQWQQPGDSSQYWNGQKGFFAGPTQQETTIQDY